MSFLLAARFFPDSYNTRKYKPMVAEELRIGSISDPTKLINALVKNFGLERALKSGIVRQNIRGLYLFFYTPCLIFPYTDINPNRSLGPECVLHLKLPRRFPESEESLSLFPVPDKS